MRLVEIDYGRYIDLDEIEFTPNDDLWEYIEQIADENVIYGTKIA